MDKSIKKGYFQEIPVQDQFFIKESHFLSNQSSFSNIIEIY